MQEANKLELHYFFNDNSHQIDALVRNKCEAELLAIAYEAAVALEISLNINSDIVAEGGFRDFWNFLGNNNNQISLILVVITIIFSRVPMSDPEAETLENELKKLSIEEKKLNIQKLKQELEQNEFNPETIGKVTKVVDSNLKILKRKSNFYTHLSKYNKVTEVSFAAVNDKYEAVFDERHVKSSEFRKFILSTNKLRSEVDSEAIIQIVSPVLRETKHKWKGIYNEETISFDMLDVQFRDEVLLEKHSFKHGSTIRCVLNVHRELDEVGDIKIKGYSVSTVLEKIEGGVVYETMQGKSYRQASKFSKSQTDLFD